MDRQQIKVNFESNDQNKSQWTTENENKYIREDIPRTNSLSSLSSRVSHIFNRFPSAYSYEDEQYIAHPVDQRLTRGYSARSSKVTTITQPTIAQTLAPFIDENDTGLILNQFRRTYAPHQYEYKASPNIKEHSGVPLRIRTMGMIDYNEGVEGTSINVNHLRHQQPRGMKQTARFISQLNPTFDYTGLDESAIQLDQLQRMKLPQTVTYKFPAHIQPVIGTIRKTPSTLSEEELPQETSINISQLRQAPTRKDLSSFNRTKQQQRQQQPPLSIMQPSARTHLPILNETAVHLDQIHRPYSPETIRYKPPAPIRSSIGTIRTTTSVLGHEAPAQEASININQLRQATSKNLPVYMGIKQQTSSITQPSTITDLPILGDWPIRLDQIHRSQIPQTIHYKAPAHIQPSTSFTKTTASARSQDEPAQETSININQLRQPVFTNFSGTGQHNC